MNYYRIFSPSNCVISLMVWWKWHLSPIAPFFFCWCKCTAVVPLYFLRRRQRKKETEERRVSWESGRCQMDETEVCEAACYNQTLSGENSETGKSEWLKNSRGKNFLIHGVRLYVSHPVTFWQHTRYQSHTKYWVNHTAFVTMLRVPVCAPASFIRWEGNSKSFKT